MHSEDFLINDGCDRQAIEAVGECLPQFNVVPPLTLIVEAIYSVDRSALMVSSEDEEILRIFDLVCKEQTNGFERLLASIHVVAEKEVVRLGRKSPIFK